MKKIFYAFIVLAALTSCADAYNIKGNSTISSLDGSKLYLKVIENGKPRSIDSCEVIHGEFKFAGLLDTVSVVRLFMDDRDLMMPVVLEEGNIVIQIDDISRKVSGTPLNDLLYSFLEQRSQLGNEFMELENKYPQLILEGMDADEARERIEMAKMPIRSKEDSLVTDFVVNNFDNILGPVVFVEMSSSVPQVEHIMSKAPDGFKNNPAVSTFYRMVTEAPEDNQDEASSEPDDATIQDILNGK